MTGSTNTAAIPLAASGAEGNINDPIWGSVSVSSFVPPTASEIGLSLGGGGITILAPNANYGAFEATTGAIPPIQWDVPWASGTYWMVLEGTTIDYASNGTSNFLGVTGWRDYASAAH